MDAKLDKILTAAFQLFRQHGFKKVTMSEIAAAAEMSRPTLYAVFASKEAVIGGLVDRQRQGCSAKLSEKLARATSLERRLSLLFEIWILEPVASIIDTVNGADMLASAAAYAPEQTNALYVEFERQLTELLAPEMRGKQRLKARDMAHIMTMATRGLKASTSSMPELRRMTDGLIVMALASTSAAGNR